MTMKRHLNEIKHSIREDIRRKTKPELIEYLTFVLNELTTPLNVESEFSLHFESVRLINILNIYCRRNFNVRQNKEVFSLNFIAKNVSRSELLEVRNCGEGTVKELEDKLSEFGLNLLD